MEGKETILLVLTTAPDLKTAQDLATALVSRKIAACVNISPGLLSVYSWNDVLQEDEEVLLLIKTREGLLENQLIPLIQELHPYDLPEIIALPIVAGEKNYLDWVLKESPGE